MTAPDAVAVVHVPALLSIAAVAGVLGCSPRTVRRRIADGVLPAVTDHGHTYVRGDDLRGYVDALEHVGPPRSRRAAARTSARRYDFLRGAQKK
jgi:excisionase family DNA binding protein